MVESKSNVSESEVEAGFECSDVASQLRSQRRAEESDANSGVDDFEATVGSKSSASASSEVEAGSESSDIESQLRELGGGRLGLEPTFGSPSSALESSEVEAGSKCIDVASQSRPQRCEESSGENSEAKNLAASVGSKSSACGFSDVGLRLAREEKERGKRMSSKCRLDSPLVRFGGVETTTMPTKFRRNDD